MPLRANLWANMPHGLARPGAVQAAEERTENGQVSGRLRPGAVWDGSLPRDWGSEGRRFKSGRPDSSEEVTKGW